MLCFATLKTKTKKIIYFINSAKTTCELFQLYVSVCLFVAPMSSRENLTSYKMSSLIRMKLNIDLY